MAKIVVVLHRLHDQLIPVWQAPTNMTVSHVLVLQYLMTNKVSSLLDNGLNPTEACEIMNIAFEGYLFRLYCGNPDAEALEAAQHAKAVRNNYDADLFQTVQTLTGFDLSGHFNSPTLARDEPNNASREKPLDDDIKHHLDNLID